MRPANKRFYYAAGVEHYRFFQMSGTGHLPDKSIKCPYDAKGVEKLGKVYDANYPAYIQSLQARNRTKCKTSNSLQDPEPVEKENKNNNYLVQKSKRGTITLYYGVFFFFGPCGSVSQSPLRGKKNDTGTKGLNHEQTAKKHVQRRVVSPGRALQRQRPKMI